MRDSVKYNPLLKSYPDSEKINRCSIGAEMLYVRLIAASDDAGRYWGEAKMIEMRLMTLRAVSGEVGAPDIERWLEELRREGLIEFYTADGRRYLNMLEVFKTLRKDVKPTIVFPARDESVTNPGRVRDGFGPLDQTRPDTDTDTDTRPDSAPLGVCGVEPKASKPKAMTCTDAQAEAIYQAYPRKVDRLSALRAIKAAAKRLAGDGKADPVGYLLACTRAFASSPAGQKPAAGEKDYRKHPASWFNAGSYENESPADPAATAPSWWTTAHALAVLEDPDIWKLWRDRLIADRPRFKPFARQAGPREGGATLAEGIIEFIAGKLAAGKVLADELAALKGGGQ